MARKNRKLGSGKSKTYDTSTAPKCVHGRPPIAYRRRSRADIKPTPKFTRSAIPYPSLSGVVTLPILFHVVYDGELTEDIKDEARASIHHTVNGTNFILAGDPSSADTWLTSQAEAAGFTMPIDDPEHGVDSNIRLTLADRIAKKDLMPFIPYNTHEGYYLDPTDPDSNYAGGLEIPEYEPSSYTEEEILALRLAYEEATEETRDAAYTALQEAEADYYLFLTDEPGILFYKFDSDLSEDYQGGTNKLNSIRDLEAGSMINQGNTPSNFFYNSQNYGGDFEITRFLAENINTKPPCIHVYTNTGGIAGGIAGDSGLGLAQGDTYQKFLRLYSLQYDYSFMPFGLAHELLHFFGVIHGWETITMRGLHKLTGTNARSDSATNVYGSVSTEITSFQFDYGFVPPFVYNEAGDSYENISDNEKTFVENIINNYLPQFFADSPIFIESSSVVSLATDTSIVTTKKFERGYPVEVASLMGILPTFWGGSYIEVDGQKKFVINPTEAASRSLRTTPLSIGDVYEGGIVFQINIDGTGLVADLQDLGEMDWYDAMDAAEGATSQGYDDWYLPGKETLQLIYNTIGNGGPEGNIGGFETSDIPRYWSSTENYYHNSWVVYFNNGGSTSNRKINTCRVRVIRSVVLPEISENTLYSVGDEIDGIGIIGSIDVNYISAYVVANTSTTSPFIQSLGNGLFQAPLLNISSNQIIYATPGSDTYAEELEAVNEAKLDYDYMYSVNPDAFEVDKMYGFKHSTGFDAWGYNPITGVLQSYPRLDEISGGSWYDSDIYFIGRDPEYPLPEYTVPPQAVPANRKGPKINIYNPVCLPSNTNKLNITFGIGLGWYDPFYPKFPEDTLVEDMFNEENCPCLYQEQSYKDKDSEGNLVTKTFTVLDSNGDMLYMEAFKDLVHTDISFGHAESGKKIVQQSIAGLRMSLKDIFVDGKWLNTITEDPYEIVVPNFPVYIGFSRDSVIPYNIKGSSYYPGGESLSISPLVDDSIFRGFGPYSLNILHRYYTTGNTNPSSNLYNPFKVEGDYTLSLVRVISFGETAGEMEQTPGYLFSDEVLELFRQPNYISSPFKIEDPLYGPINFNFILNIMHYKGVGPSIPCAITKGQAENLNDKIANSIGNLMNMKNYSILTGYNSLLGAADPLASAVSAQAYINDAVDFIADYDVSTYQGGCTDPISPNYDPNATVDNGTCIEPIYGCIDPTANNYDEGANTDDGSCLFYSLAPIPLYAKHVCNDTTTPVCNLYDNSGDIAVNGEVAEISIPGESPWIYQSSNYGISDNSLLNQGTTWYSQALNYIRPYQYNCDENPLASEVEGPENLSGGCVNVEDNSVCIYPSVDYFHCSVLEAGDGLSLLQGYMNQEDFTMTCEDGGTPGIGRNVNNSFFIIGTILLEDVLFTSLGVPYVGRFISDLNGTLYEFSSTKEINRSNPLFFRNQLSLDNLSQAEKDLKNMSKIKESLKKIINFTN